MSRSGRSTALGVLRVVMLGAGLALAGCATMMRTPLPAALLPEADAALGRERIRLFADSEPAALVSVVRDRFDGAVPGRPEYLFLSGGGADGAFGAGLLVGWSRAGGRPVFDLVTGISVGALIAPFAFLGPQYDDELTELFTTVSTGDFLNITLLRPLFGGSAFTDTTPFRRLIAKYADAALVEEVARAHRSGRRLLVGTTQLDAQRPVVWNMGAIAASENPDRVALFQSILLASASIPGVFEPVLVDVVLPSGRYDELHVDGGVTNSVFPFPADLDLGSLSAPGLADPVLYVIRNGKITPEYEAVDLGVADIAQRSISTLIKTQANGDIFRMFAAARASGIEMNLAYIPDTFEAESEEFLDPQYMRALFTLGYDAALDGAPWSRVPPPPIE